MKPAFYFSLLLILLFNVDAFSQNQEKVLKTIPKKIPKVATIKLSLLDLPGVVNEKSTWEFSFELRIINEAGEYEATKAGKLKHMDEQEKIGDLIYKNSFTRKSLSQPQNRSIIFQIPLNEEIQEKLKNEPKNRVNLSNVTITDEVIKKSREDSAKAQVFLFYANAIVYDAKLKKTTIIPMSRIFPFRIYPSLDFFMSLKIDNDGYSINGTLPEGAVLKNVPAKP